MFWIQVGIVLGFPGGTVVTNLPANAGDVGLIPGWERSPGERDGTHFRILAWKIPWTEEHDELASGRSQSQTRLSMHTSPMDGEGVATRCFCEVKV